MQVFVTLDGGGMITIFPERSLPTFALVIFLGNAACDQLHASRYDVLPRISDQEMDVMDVTI